MKGTGQAGTGPGWDQAAAALLRELGLCPFRRGERDLCRVLALAAEEPERLAEGVGSYCVRAAGERGVDPRAVERNLSRQLERLWQGQPQLRRWFPRCLGRPSAAALLTVLAGELRRRGARPG